MILFNSLGFIFRFLPIFLVIYCLVPARDREIVLLVGSLLFYTMGMKEMVLVLIGLTLVNYWLGSIIYKSNWLGETEKEASAFTAVLILDAGALVLCKTLLSYVPGFSLPLGFSFYIFKMISYQCEMVRGEMKTKPTFISTAVYFTMFPQVTQGPIMRYGKGCFDRPDGRKMSAASFVNGLYFFIVGLGMKVLLADRLSILWNEIGKIGYESISTPLAWLGAYGYSLELYMDFWGYSLMAAGIGMMLGFRFVVNFLHPYTACGVADFYRRWHMTLGTWFRDFLYIPMGGSRKGNVRTVVNLLVVWILTGLWHGTTLNFLLWGVILGLLIIWEKFAVKDLMKRYPVIGHFHVLVLIPLTWVIFAIPDMKLLGVYFTRLFPFFGGGAHVNSGDFLKYLNTYWGLLLAGALLCMPPVYRIFVKKRNTPVMTVLIAALFWVCVYYMSVASSNPFMYFNF